mgnify:CR=1 FL=1
MAIEIALVLFLLIIVGSWALFTAQRLNSLHIRTDASLAQLQAALDRRAAVTAAVAPGLAALAQRAESTELYQGHFEPRTLAERELSAAIVREFPAERRPAALADRGPDGIDDHRLAGGSGTTGLGGVGHDWVLPQGGQAVVAVSA